MGPWLRAWPQPPWAPPQQARVRFGASGRAPALCLVGRCPVRTGLCRRHSGPSAALASVRGVTGLEPALGAALQGGAKRGWSGGGAGLIEAGVGRTATTEPGTPGGLVAGSSSPTAMAPESRGQVQMATCHSEPGCSGTFSQSLIQSEGGMAPRGHRASLLGSEVLWPPQPRLGLWHSCLAALEHCSVLALPGLWVWFWC